MSLFKYTLPSGSEFTMTAPAGTTQLEADLIFFNQVAAGTFVGYSVGQTLTSAQAMVSKFALSRLDRGTAGVDITAILSVVNGVPTTSTPASMPVEAAAIVSLVNAGPTVRAIPSLINIPLTNPITQADLVNVNSGGSTGIGATTGIGGSTNTDATIAGGATIDANGNQSFTVIGITTGITTDLAPPPIGPLSSDQVRGILAQIANLVDQPFNVMSDSKGVGQFGLTVPQLEQVGLVKPGVWQRFIFDPAPLTAVLSSPAIWTGRGGINSAQDFLGSVTAQNSAQINLMQNAYQGLLGTGAISVPALPSILASQGQIFTQSGLQGISSLSALTNTSLSVPTVVSSTLSGTPVASLLSSATTNLSTIGSGAIGAIPGVASLTSGLSRSAIGDVGALVATASRFGTEAATAWSQGNGGVLSAITGSVNSLVGGAGDNISSLTSALNITGKASQFATSFATPGANLGNLGNFDAGSISGLADKLTGSASGLADNLSGAVTNSVAALTAGLGGIGDKLTGGLANLSKLADLGSLGKLGGLLGGGGDGLVSATQVAAGFSNTVDRSTVDAAFVKILGSNKIPVPTFEYPSENSLSLGAGLDIASAQKTLQNLKSQGGALLAQASQISSVATAAVASARGVANSAGGVISNALTQTIRG